MLLEFFKPRIMLCKISSVFIWLGSSQSLLWYGLCCYIFWFYVGTRFHVRLTFRSVRARLQHISVGSSAFGYFLYVMRNWQAVWSSWPKCVRCMETGVYGTCVCTVGDAWMFITVFKTSSTWPISALSSHYLITPATRPKPCKHSRS